MTNKENKDLSFDNLGISPSLLEQLQKLKFNQPTPIQHQAIPIAITGQDLMGIAQTGTGKTVAFGVPMIQRLHTTKGTGLVILPTRELALQVDQSLRDLGQALGLKTVVLIGGTAIEPQMRKLAKRPHVIIATPGRLMDHIQRKKTIVNSVKVIVLDEADRMLDMGFEPEIRKILSAIPKGEKQTMLFSATMPRKITSLANTYMRSPLRVEVAPAGTTAEKIEQEVFIVPKPEKLSLLNEILSEYNERVLIFSRTKHGAKKICRAIDQMGHRSAELHSNRSLSQRTKALKDFKSGFCKVLVATDIASRGIDVKDIELVINFDLPDNPEDYVHRIGRTGRAGKTGKAISFVVPEQKRDLLTIEKLISTRLPISKLPKFEKHISAPRAPRKPRRNWQESKPKPRAKTTKNFSSRGRRTRRPFKRGKR
ncbi:hypothetical protein C0580_03050 [Candidatus Parcubacteria bacterium]|nr:MAG: hypothetical protein C0580_03050 [Candidatus Parcubacteria bacterium]